MAQWKKWQCQGCGAIVSNSKERRTLDESQHPAVYGEVVDLLSGYYNVQPSDVKTMIQPVDVLEKGLERSYLCRKTCFTALEKISNHKKKIRELTADMERIKRTFLEHVKQLYPHREETTSPALSPPVRPRNLFAGASGISPVRPSASLPTVTVRFLSYNNVDLHICSMYM